MKKQPDKRFWQGKRVLVTGHTGFKGSWLSAWLVKMGATVLGYSLAPDEVYQPLFQAAALAGRMDSTFGDVLAFSELSKTFERTRPEIVLHLAAQPLVRLSYDEPMETFHVNVQGTVHVLEACRRASSVKSVVVVTTDKCYENKEWPWPYRETDQLGGHDPYSCSKACAELVVASYRRSFLEKDETFLGSARAGNVIGGGDFAKDRLVPDIVRAFQSGEAVEIRSPNATRPWQHVLEPLSGYLLLAEALLAQRTECASPFNFGPVSEAPVKDVVDLASDVLGGEVHYPKVQPKAPHEAGRLHLDSHKASDLLAWNPRLDLRSSVEMTAEFYKAWSQGSDPWELMLKDIQAFENSPTLA